MRIEFQNHHGKAVLVSRFSKFCSPKSFGMSVVELSEPSGLKAADATNRIGIRANTIATIATRWRQPTARNQLWPVIG